MPYWRVVLFVGYTIASIITVNVSMSYQSWTRSSNATNKTAILFPGKVLQDYIRSLESSVCNMVTCFNTALNPI